MKRDILLIILCLVLMVGCSKVVPDSRAMTPPIDIVEESAKEIKKHIKDAHYLVTTSPVVEEPQEVEEAPVEEVIEEVIEVSDEDIGLEIASEQEPGLIYIGDYRITAYEWTGNPCANGEYPTEGYTIACNDLPLGTEVWIEGVGYRVVEDRGGGGEGWMDLYLGDVSACYEWGVQYRSVYVYE